MSADADARKRAAELWALASDENMEHLLVWHAVKKRAEAGGFNGVQIGDYAKAREAMAVVGEIPEAVKEQA